MTEMVHWKKKVEGFAPISKLAHEGEMPIAEFMHKLAEVLTSEAVDAGKTPDEGLQAVVDRCREFRDIEGEDVDDTKERADDVLSAMYDWADANNVWIIPSWALD
jgi:hypothetical protein